MDRRLDPGSRWTKDRRAPAGGALADLFEEGRAVTAAELFDPASPADAGEVATWLAHAQASGLIDQCAPSGEAGTGAYRRTGGTPAGWSRRSDDGAYEHRWSRARQAALALARAAEDAQPDPPPADVAPSAAPTEAARARFATRVLDDRVTVDVVGSVDVASAEAFEQVLLEAIATTPPSLTVDLRRARHFDSSGIAVLVRVLRRCRRQHTAFSLCAAASGGVRTVLDLAGMTSVFPLVDGC